MKKILLYIIVLYALGVFIVHTTNAQNIGEQDAAPTENKVRTSLFFMPNFQFANHSAGFSSFGGCESCLSTDKGSFIDADGVNYNFSLGIEHRFTDRFSIQGRLGFQNNTVQFNSGPLFLTWSNNGSTPQPVYVEHQLNVVNSMIGIQVLPSFSIGDKFLISLGFSGFVNVSPTFAYKETLLDQSGQLSYNQSENQKERNIYPSGSKFTNPQTFIFGLHPAISYKIPLSVMFVIEPEFSYFMSLNDMLKDANWKYGSVNMGIKVHLLSLSHFTPNQCPDGMMLDSYGNCIEITKPCPTGFIRNPAGDCVPICPTGFVYNEKIKECVEQGKCPAGFELNQSGNCVKKCKSGYVFDIALQDCKMIIPPFTTDCKGTLISIPFTTMQNAEEFLRDIKALWDSQAMNIVKVQDEIDPRVVVYSVQTGCYNDSGTAAAVSRELYDIVDQNNLSQKYANLTILLKGNK